MPQRSGLTEDKGPLGETGGLIEAWTESVLGLENLPGADAVSLCFTGADVNCPSEVEGPSLVCFSWTRR